MKRTFLILTLAAQLAAVPAFAQTSTATTGTADTASTSGTFGSDWSKTLRPAMFGEDGTKVRSETEIASQWGTLSDEDKDMIRRDCETYMKQSDNADGTTGAATGSTGTGTDSTASSTGTSTGASTGTSMDGSAPAIEVTSEQMEEICAATKDL